ncbi:MAG: 3'-5' exonuclease [Clostridiales bacterium]|nr:3'-5' exonuclease [Clostridiales bacterium]
MNYLFFDIECAGVFKNVAKICAFGYCLTDEQFHILEKEDILINPQGGFHLTDRRGEQGIVLPYKYEEFKKYPTFEAQAERIYGLLQDENTLVVGHAVQNDVKYLNLESRRFQLPSFSFRFVDTQFLYMNVIGDFSRQYGLGVIAERLGVEFTPHRAVDDAYATMKVAQALCKSENCSLTELMKKYDVTAGKIDDYEIVQTTSIAAQKYKEEKDKAREERERARAQFHIFADKERRKRAKEGKLKGKTVCFSHALELQTPLAKKLLKAAFDNAAGITYRAEECDLYVCFETENCPRRQSVQAKNIPVFTPESFAALLGV